MGIKWKIYILKKISQREPFGGISANLKPLYNGNMPKSIYCKVVSQHDFCGRKSHFWQTHIFGKLPFLMQCNSDDVRFWLTLNLVTLEMTEYPPPQYSNTLRVLLSWAPDLSSTSVLSRSEYYHIPPKS